MDALASPTVPVSWGELIDKITILEIKRERITEPLAQTHIAQEHRLLSATGALALQVEAVRALADELRRVNAALWDIEDAIRAAERKAQFGPGFVRLARSVYKANDARAALKRRINDLLGSDLVEEKSYAGAAESGEEGAVTFIAPAR
jgi:hypothetical protein